MKKPPSVKTISFYLLTVFILLTLSVIGTGDDTV